MTLQIVRPGMFTTVQDGGRWGAQSRGVPVSGAMDVFSYRLANLLVGNAAGAAALEVTLIGPEVVFADRAAFAVTGAEFALSLDERPIAMNTTIEARRGSRLVFGARTRGARAYIAVAGGIDVPRVLGSRSTHVGSSMGGYQGRALRAGDDVPVGAASWPAFGGRSGVVPLPVGGARLRVVPCEGMSLLTAARYVVSPRSNRMGYRLTGPAAATASRGDLISGPVPLGAIQVPPTGEPILLMADHATTGGYAIAATVISADVPVAAQLAPGDWIDFEVCALDDADRAMREREAALTGSLA